MIKYTVCIYYNVIHSIAVADYHCPAHTCVIARGVRPSSAVVRPTDLDQLSAATSHRQQNGTVTVSRQTATGVCESVGGLRRAVLCVLGEKTQMKVTVMCSLLCITFDKFRHSFVIFDMNHPDNSF